MEDPRAAIAFAIIAVVFIAFIAFLISVIRSEKKKEEYEWQPRRYGNRNEKGK